jgi:tripartite-type tricarboxylate transporter receptor subunit TctC
MNRYSRIIAALATALSLGASTASAFPIGGRPIRLVVPYPAGGEVLDGTARLMAHRLSEALGVSVVVENRPGAGNVVGNQAVAASAPDGHTLLYSAVTSFTMLPHQLSKRPYDELRDFTPITTVFRSALVLFAHPSLPANDVRELIAYAKANPGKVAFASWQLGGLNHVYLEMLRSDTGADMLHVPYKSGLDAQRDLVEGRIHLMMAANATQVAWVRAGKLKALGVASAARSRAVNEVPTFMEQGFPGYEHAGTLAIFGPAKLPPEVVKRLNSEFVRILRNSEVIDFFSRVAPLAEVEPSTPEELGALVKTQSEYFGPIIRKLGIRLD